ATLDNLSATPNNAFMAPNNIVIGISVDKDLLHDRIYKRIVNRIKNEGMIEEIYNLHYKNKVSWKRLESFGLEYKFISQYLKKSKLEPTSYNTLSPTLEQTINNLSTATNQYAKRQITWFNKTPGLIWVDGNDKKQLYKKTEQLVKEFINKKTDQ
ncbi:MAG: tRNA dimethylallyltransferase, partial [Patescibacteria group bacterium]